jgi:hypothetical protein
VSGIITLSVETLAIIFTGRSGGQTQRIEAQHLKLGPAGRAGENLAPIHIEVRDPDRMPTGGTRRRHLVLRSVQLKSILTTRVVKVPPHSTRAEKEATQNERSMPESVFPEMSRLRG